MVSICVLISPFVLLNSSHPKKNDLFGRQTRHVLTALNVGQLMFVTCWDDSKLANPFGKGWDPDCSRGLDFQIFVCQSCAGIHREHGKPRRCLPSRDTDVGWLVDPLTVNFKVWTQDQKHLLLWMEYCRGHLRDRCRTFVSLKICCS